MINTRLKQKISINVWEDEYQAFKKKCLEERTTPSAMINAFIRNYEKGASIEEPSVFQRVFSLMQEFAPHVYDELSDKRVEEITDSLQEITKNPENFEVVTKIFNDWDKHGSSSEWHFAQYFRGIIIGNDK